MSSLRRLAIVVQRARSPDRSSIGGRVTALTTAAASLESASRRSQARASRTSGRWKSAPSPRKRNGTPRSSKAAAISRRLAPAAAGDDADALGPHLAGGDAPLDVASSGLRLRALALAAPQTHLRGVGHDALGRTTEDRVRRGADGRTEPLRAGQFDGLATGEAAPEVRGRDLAVPTEGAQPLGWIARRDDVLAGGQHRDQVAMRGSRVLQLIDQDEGEALGDGGADVGVLAKQAAQFDHQVAAVDAAALAQDPVVRGIELRELQLPARGLPAGRVACGPSLLLGPLAQFSGADGLGLQRVDAAQEPGEETRGIAPDLMTAEGQLVEAVEQDRQPVGRGDADDERVDPGLERVLQEQDLGDPGVGVDRQVLVRGIDERLDPGAKGRGGGPR